MRKVLFSLLMFITCGLTCSAQQKVYIYLSDGEVITKNVSEIDSISFTEPVKPPVEPEAVDLGLSVKWSNINYGAYEPEETGILIGWGDVTGSQQAANLAYYPTSNPVWSISKSQYDIVFVNWGEQWRMPTNDEIKELCDSCDWTYVNEEGKEGFTVTSRINSASIFLPVTGIREESVVSSPAVGAYWSGSLSSENSQRAMALYFTHVETDSINASSEQIRYKGLAIRPVYGELHNAVMIKSAEAASVASTSAKVPAYLYGALSDVEELGIAYAVDSLGIDVEGIDKVCVSKGFEEGSYTFTLSDLSPNTTYYYVAYAKYDGETLCGDTLSFTTENRFPVPAEPVDLGLSVKWAPWNMGASCDTEYGDLMAWGDPTGLSESNDPSDFACDGLSTIAATHYDVAHEQWGDKWRLPSQSEIEELEMLPWEYHEDYKGSGISGWILRGNNDSIFIPRAGYVRNNAQVGRNEAAYYWTARYSEKNSDYATYCQLNTKIINASEWSKAIRMAVRPVYGDVNSAADLDPNDPIDVDGHQAVTLGGKIRWATCNLGATKSSDAGDFYAWAEVSPKSDYSRNLYSYYANGVYDQLPDTITGAEYDAATANWGENWRMPTRAELDYLIYYCKSQWTTVDGVYGCKFTSNSNGNSIFLPAEGYMNGTSFVGETSSLYYWSSSSADSRWPDEGMAFYLDATSSNMTTNFEYRYKGMLVRPVTDVTTAK